MSKARSTCFAAFLLLKLADAAWADGVVHAPVIADASPQKLEQLIYKGVIGNVLDTLPIDPAKRVDLQRTSAVISNTFSGRTLSVVLGLSNPVLIIGGLAWGLWAASNIRPVALDTPVTAHTSSAGEPIVTNESLVTSSDSLPAEPRLADEPVAGVSSVALNSLSDTALPEVTPHPVIRVWLPQRVRE